MTRWLILCAALAGCCCAQTELAKELSFETAHPAGRPGGWMGGPPDSVFADDKVVHGGQWSARIESKPDNPQGFTALTRRLPMDFAGGEIVLRGWLRTEDVTGFAGLWMREDAPSGQVAFDNMASQQLNGTTGWRQYSVRLPLRTEARQLFFGFLISGTGKAWADDLELLVDGKPVWEAPKAQRAKTALDEDHQFDGGSGVSLESLSPVQVENLTRLGKIWGFLKYHHPSITQGKRHWDYDLFRVLPAVLASNGREAANSAVQNWISALGEVAPCNPCAKLDEGEIQLRPELDWIADERSLGKELSRSLQWIHVNRPGGASQFYVTLAPNVGNPQKDFVPRVALARSKDAFQLELMALIARVNDTHANLWSSLALRPPAGECLIPVKMRFIEGQAVVAEVSPGETILKRGDAIVELDGVAVTDLVKRWAPYYAASNEPTKLRDIARTMLRGACVEASLKLRRDGETIALKAARVKPNAEAMRSWAKNDRPGDALTTPPSSCLSRWGSCWWTSPRISCDSRSAIWPTPARSIGARSSR